MDCRERKQLDGNSQGELFLVESRATQIPPPNGRNGDTYLLNVYLLTARRPFFAAGGSVEFSAPSPFEEAYEGQAEMGM